MDPGLILLAGLLAVILLQLFRMRRVQRQAASTQASVELGSTVITTAGLLGTVVDLDEESVTIESTPGNRTRWVRVAVARVTPPAAALQDRPSTTDGPDTTATTD